MQFALIFFLKKFFYYYQTFTHKIKVNKICSTSKIYNYITKIKIKIEPKGGNIDLDINLKLISKKEEEATCFRLHHITTNMNTGTLGYYFKKNLRLF